MVKIVDPNNTIKSVEESEIQRDGLMKRFQLYFKIKSIPSYVLEVISRKCAGNPLFSIHYFINMLFCGFLEIKKNGKVESTDIFK